jgi:hypothetical protein
MGFEDHIHHHNTFKKEGGVKDDLMGIEEYLEKCSASIAAAFHRHFKSDLITRDGSEGYFIEKDAIQSLMKVPMERLVKDLQESWPLSGSELV